MAVGGVRQSEPAPSPRAFRDVGIGSHLVHCDRAVALSEGIVLLRDAINVDGKPTARTAAVWSLIGSTVWPVRTEGRPPPTRRPCVCVSYSARTKRSVRTLVSVVRLGGTFERASEEAFAGRSAHRRMRGAARARHSEKTRPPLRCVIGVALARSRTYAKGQFFNRFLVADTRIV